MAVKEFEGRNEKEAIERAIDALGLDEEDIDVEVVENKKSGFLFMGGKVKIRVHLGDDEFEDEADTSDDAPTSGEASPPATSTETETEPGPEGALDPETDFERTMVEFVAGLIKRVGIDATISIMYREEQKIGIDIDTDDTGIIIGKRGATLEALQLIVNIAAGRLGTESIRVILDAEDYRYRREQNLVRLANRVAEDVRRSGKSKLLQPMNPFERRLIHTTLNDSDDVVTESEGDGLYKKVRIIYKGNAPMQH